MDFNNIIKNFNFEGNFITGYSYGSGHINQTFVLIFKKNEHCYRRYLSQRINHNVFKDVPALMANIEKVTEFQRNEIIEKGGNPNVEVLTLVRTKDNSPYYKDNYGNYFRSYYFINEGIGFDKTVKPEHFYESGVAFGKFQRLLSNFNADELNETIPNFHNTKIRYQNLVTAINNNRSNRLHLVKNEVDFLLSRKEYSERIVNYLESSEMPYRVTHNDTKLNNVLINPVTDKAVCVIDLDTIMKGSIIYDFGDSIRFGANSSEEDEKDLSKVNFDISLFETYTKGFLKELKGSLTTLEVNNLAFGGILLTYETALRFLTDFLEGDNYFRTKYSDHNLDRTRTQIKLVKDMEKVLDKMESIVKNIYYQK